MKTIGIGLIGSGFMGRTNAETVAKYLKNAKLSAITGGSRAATLAAEYGVAAEPSLDALLSRKDVDAVMISTPHAAHVKEAVAAARAGKHILLDKPMATTLDDCDLILAATRASGSKLMIMYGQRFRDCNIEAHRLVHTGAIGKVLMMQEQILATGGLQSLPPWQSLPENVGTFVGHAVHNIDRIRWITGAEVTSVSAQVQCDPISGNEVSTMALLTLTNGGMATVWASWQIAAPLFPHTASSSLIAGETGNIDLDAYGEVRLGARGQWEVKAVQPPIDWAGEGALSPVRMEAYRRQHQEFIDAILEDRSPSVTGEDGRAAVEVALAAYQSAAEGRTIHLHTQEGRQHLSQLTINGGAKAITSPLPSFLATSGRTFGTEEETLLLGAIRSGCLSRNGGRMVKGLEKDFAAAIGVKHAIASSSGTSSLHLALAALDLEPGDEVIVPPITDIGTILPVIWQNAIPVFADVDPRTMLLDPKNVEKAITPRTRAVMVVHLAGTPCAMDELITICKAKNVVLIEDCSQAFWAEYDGKLVGSMGDLSCFSLQQSKHMTCGEGGLTLTNDDAYARRALLFSDKAWPREAGTLGSSRFLFLSQNYRMNELSGAVAWAQLGKVADTVARRRKSAGLLTEKISGLTGVTGPHVPPKSRPAYWLYMLRVDEASGTDAKTFGEALVAEGVPAWVQYIIDPLYMSPVFAEHATYGTSGYPFTAYPSQKFERGLCPNAEQALKHVIAIHWNENYTEAHVEQIAAAIHKVAEHFATR